MNSETCAIAFMKKIMDLLKTDQLKTDQSAHDMDHLLKLTHSQVPQTHISDSGGVSDNNSTANMTSIHPHGEQISVYSTHIKDKIKEYITTMKNAYINEVGNVLSFQRKSKPPVFHKCVAALICDKDKRAFVATICTGTHWNSKKKCYQTPCSMHAESLCYDTAPVFFQMEMLKCLSGKDSIFTHLPHERFKLKEGVEFHLLITEPPCGWCQDGENPCFDWKRSTAVPPHIPTCSSKILINSVMGIQGYVSHLLEKSIFVSTVTILYDKNKVITRKPTLKFKFEFGTKFEVHVPEFHLMEYDPESFNCGNDVTFQPMNLMSPKNDGDSKVSSHPDGVGSGIKSSKHSANKYLSPVEAGKHSIIAVLPPQDEHLLQIYDSDDGSVQTLHPKEGFCIKEHAYKVHENLKKSVDQILQDKRKIVIEDTYKVLTREYMDSALERYIDTLQKTIDDLTKNLQKLTIVMSTSNQNNENKSISQLLKEAFQDNITHTFSSLDKWSNLTEELKAKISKVIEEGNTCLEDNEIIRKIQMNSEDVSLDCSWVKYFEIPQEVAQ
ncbi:uncharacterized protein [Dysidea avara]